MLDPDYLERAGDLVAGVYSEIEADMCDHLVRAILAGDVSDWRSQTALQLLAQGQAPQIRMVLERYRDKINEAVRREVEEALARSDAHDLAVVKRALGIDLPKVSTQQVALAVKTICEMLERDNVDLMNGARDAFFRETSRAVAEAGAGWTSIDEAMLRATRRLARNGIDTIQYRDPTTGNKTVRNHVDVAVRRHVRTQLQQACAERTMQVCQRTGCGFVEVSSHYGARPSHQEWEGRVYSLKGRVTVDGVTYEDFGEGTGYYGTGPYAALGDRLCGVNCRHHWGPWFPGMPRAYHPNPQHPSGKTNEEIYELTQRQRALERDLRATKRELSAAEAAYDADPSLKNQTEVNKLRERLKAQNDRMKRLVSDNRDVLTRQPNRERAGDMPRNAAPRGTGVSLDDYLRSPEVAKRLKDAGVSRSEARRRIVGNMRAGDEPTRTFSHRTAQQQREELDKALSSQSREEKQRRRDAAAMELVRREQPESLGAPFTTEEARAVFGSTELSSNVEPATVREIAQHVEDSVLSNDPARTNAARLMARSIDEGRLRIIADEEAGQSHYDHATRAITLNRKGKASARTVAHENAHLSDHQIDATYTARKITQAGEELRDYTTPAGQYATLHYGEERAGKTLMRRIGKVNRKGETAAWRDLKRKLGVRTDQQAIESIHARRRALGLDDVHSLSDIIHAASGGHCRINYGHKVEYWSDSSRVLETWADYNAALVTSPMEAQLIRELFPAETAIMDEMLEVMAG